MNTDLILANVTRHVALNNEEKNLFLGLLEPKKIKRRQLHHKEGEICKYSTFVVDGALKGFTVDKNGIEHWWIADLYSLFSQKPGILNIEAIVDSDVLLLSKENRDLLFDKVPKFERFFRILIENSHVANQQRLINNLSLTAEERYELFMKKYPAILSCAPLHSIASYLGITPEFLSKIRARMAKKQA
jgi:CRP-like cAMP-binding protein